MPLPELPFKGKITKFIITPICEFRNVLGDPIGEEKMKPIIHYIGNDLNIRRLIGELESQINEQLLSKIKTTDD